MAGPMEACAGCGASAQKHPWGCVWNFNDGRGAVSQPCCNDCYKDPAHRTTKLRGHFFDRQTADTVGVAKAGSSTLGR